MADLAKRPDMSSQPQTESVPSCISPGMPVGDVVLTGALIASVAGTLLMSTAAGYGTDATSELMASIASTLTLFFIGLLAVSLAVVRLSQEGGFAALLGKIGAVGSFALACVTVVVWVVGMAWTLADLQIEMIHARAHPKAIRRLGAGEIGVGAMSMLALGVMTAALLCSWKVRGAASFMHCCAVLIFEALSVIGYAAEHRELPEFLEFINVGDYNGKRGLEAQVAGGAIAVTALLMLMGTSVAVQYGTNMCIPQVCLCVLLAVGVAVAEGGQIDQSAHLWGVAIPMNSTLTYMHIINTTAVIITALTTCGWATEMRSNDATQDRQQTEANGLQRASWRVGDMVLTGALLSSVAALLLQSTAWGYRTDDASDLMASVGSTITLFFIALLAVSLAVVRLSQEGGFAAVLAKGAVWATLVLAFGAAVVWAVGFAWLLADLGPGFNTASRLLGAGQIGAGLMSMIALGVMTAALLCSWKVRGVVSFMHCCAVLIFEALSIIGYAAEFLEVINGDHFSSSYYHEAGFEAQIAGGAIAAAALLMMMGASVIVQCGTNMRIPQVCLCVLLAVGVVVAEGGRIAQTAKTLNYPRWSVHRVANPYAAYMHVSCAVAVVVTVLTTCSIHAYQAKAEPGTDMPDEHA